MSSAPSLPGRMTVIGPENGYESPGSPSLQRLQSKRRRKRGERRRLRPSTSADESSGEAGGLETGTYIINGGAGSEKKFGDLKRPRKTAGFRDRIGCYTWTWFTMNMATGGIANVLHSIPYRSDWLRIIGIVVFLFNVFLFLMNCLLLTLRFRWNPGSFRLSFISPSESLFIPASVVSTGTILINSCQYGIPETGEWFQTTMQVCFWVYVAIAVVASAGIYLIIWSTQTFPIHTMTPIWIFPAYPLLLTAPFAANLIDSLPDAAAAARINSTAVAFGSICVQGTGFLVSLMIYAAFIYRLMTQKLPRETARPGMFVSVGPSGFTVAGIVHLGNTVMQKIMPNGYLGNDSAGFFFKIVADIAGLWLWGLSLWFFIVSVGAHWQVLQFRNAKHHMHYDMTWYSFVFPNTAMITATQAIGRTFESDAIQIFGTVLSVMLIVLWIFVFGMMLRALYLRRILWPDEDIEGTEMPAKELEPGINDGVAINGGVTGNHPGGV